MQVIYGLKNIGKFKRPVVALGVFDGVHAGHRRVLRACLRKAGQVRGTSVALTFWPHPQKMPGIYSLQHRLRLFSELGIDACIVIRFNRRFSRMSAQEFARQVLSGRLKAQYVYVGENFRFGNKAKGNAAALKRLGKKYAFKVEALPELRRKGEVISSTGLRRLIRAGKLSRAGKLLGRRVAILGTVVHGDAAGAGLGFPTANLNPHHEVIPPHGVYAVRAIVAGREHPAACYIGGKPKFLRRRRHKRLPFANIEVHIPGFRKKIYGQLLEVRFLRKVREERHFPSPQELVTQIKKDLRRIRAILPSPY